MFISIFQTLNLLLFLGVVIGIPWFMFTVLRSLRKIESRLESIESKIRNENIS